MTRTRCIGIIGAIAVLVLVATPAVAQSNNCMADVSSANSCTANDVSIAAVKQGTVNVFQGGIPGTNQCIAGSTFSFTADFEVKTTSSSTRSNVGIFFGTGQNSALHGSCTNAILAPTHPCAYVNGVATGTCGDKNYSEKDTSKNGEPGIEATQASCGDTASGDSSIDFGAGTHSAVLEVDGVTCPATNTSPCPASSGFTGTCLALPTCSSWYQPANNMPVCESPSPNYPWVAAAVPGAPSKCTCGIVYVPVTPITVAPTVQKACTTTNTQGAGPGGTPVFTQNPSTQSPTSCDAGVEGGTATYYVAITNTSTTPGNNIVVDQICDNQYGEIYKRTGYLGPACAAGTSGITPSNVDCPPGGSTGIAPGTTGTCSFTAVVGENANITDTVKASGHSALSSTSTFTDTLSNSVTVTSSDAPSYAKTSKGVEAAPVAACVTVRYDVTVKNTGSYDEDIVLSQTGLPGGAGYVSALSDGHFGDITQVHGTANTDGSVTGTTCGIGTGLAGSGTASNATGGGTFPQTLLHGTGSVPTSDGGTYSCQFDGVVCGTPGPIYNPPGNSGGTQVCAEGLQSPSSAVNPNLSVEAGETGSVSVTATPFVANVCFAVTGQ